MPKTSRPTPFRQSGVRLGGAQDVPSGLRLRFTPSTRPMAPAGNGAATVWNRTTRLKMAEVSSASGPMAVRIVSEIPDDIVAVNVFEPRARATEAPHEYGMALGNWNRRR